MKIIKYIGNRPKSQLKSEVGENFIFIYYEENDMFNVTFDFINCN